MRREFEVRRAEYGSPGGPVQLVDVVNIGGRWLALPHIVTRTQELPPERLKFIEEPICETCQGHKRIRVPAPGGQMMELPWCPACCRPGDAFSPISLTPLPPEHFSNNGGHPLLDLADCDVDLAALVLGQLRKLYGERATMGWEAGRLVRLLGEIEDDYQALQPLAKTQPGDDQP